MLTDDEKTAIDEARSHVPTNRAACITAMLSVQRHRGHIDDETLGDIAQHLDMSRAELDDVATFYNQIFRRPVGRHVVRLCRSVSCWLMGLDGLQRAVESATEASFGETSADERFTVLPIQCLGCCDRAPAFMVDDELYTRVEPAAVSALLEGYE